MNILINFKMAESLNVEEVLQGVFEDIFKLMTMKSLVVGKM
jgi:hypothetical protein